MRGIGWDVISHIAPSQGEAYGKTDTFAELPAAENNTDKVYLVRFATGVIFVNRKRSGLYRSDGTAWNRLGTIVVAGSESPSPGFLPSNPPTGKYPITNVYLDPSTNKLIVKFKM